MQKVASPWAVAPLHICLMKPAESTNRYLRLSTLYEENERDESSASNHVAHIPELLELIIAELRWDGQTLAKLARVSACFHTISIKYLWSGENTSQGWLNFSQLLKLLPVRLFKFDGPSRGYWTWSLKRKPKESHWSRFQHYSSLITSLHVNLSLFSPCLVELIGERSEELLPRLRSLTVTMDTGLGYSDAIWMLLGGLSLEWLEIIGNFCSGEYYTHDFSRLEAFASFSRLLPVRSPNVRFLSLNEFPGPTYSAYPDFVAEFCAAVQSLSSLRTFCWWSTVFIPTEIADLVATHQALSNVFLYPLLEWPPSCGESLVCPSLRELELCGTPAALWTALQTIAHPHLLSELILTFLYNDQPPPEDFQPFFNLFQLTVNLDHLILDFTCHPIAWDQIRPILNCKLISNLTINSYTRIMGLDDDAVEQIASGLLHLQKLRVTSREEYGQSGVSLYGLASLARHNPMLQELTIGVTTRVLDSVRERSFVELDLSVQRPLGFLELLGSEINTSDDMPEFLGPQRTAKVLNTLWPSLQYSNLHISWYNHSIRFDSWNKVKGFMAGLD